MTPDELDTALCTVEAGCEPGWIPRQVARRDIMAAFQAIRRERDEARGKLNENAVRVLRRRDDAEQLAETLRSRKAGSLARARRQAGDLATKLADLARSMAAEARPPVTGFVTPSAPFPRTEVQP